MDPMSIALICTVAFGIVVGLTAFVRQLLLSRDKKLNDLAQQKALKQEASELEKLRSQMSSHERFNPHYLVIDENKDAIQYVDQKIEAVFRKKEALIDRYSQVALKESTAIISGDLLSADRKAMCDRLREKIDAELKSYDHELAQLQNSRGTLWNEHVGLQTYLLEQEKLRNEHLDNLYSQHSVMLEKIYLRHDESADNIAKQNLEASSQTYKSIFSAPIEFLKSFFGLSSNISKDAAKKEIQLRHAVHEAEKLINGEEDNDMQPIEKSINHTLLDKKVEDEISFSASQ